VTVAVGIVGDAGEQVVVSLPLLVSRPD